MLEALLRGGEKSVQNQLRNVLDHALRITERGDIPSPW